MARNVQREGTAREDRCRKKGEERVNEGKETLVERFLGCLWGACCT